MDLSAEDDNVVIPRTFECPSCGTLFVCNRAEPFCIKDHPGQYHLQWIEWAEAACPACKTWEKPYQQHVVNPASDDEIVVLYPPKGFLKEA